MEFNLLDDLLPSLSRIPEGRIRAALAKKPATKLGPVVEYFIARQSYYPTLPPLSQLPGSSTVLAFQQYELSPSFFDFNDTNLAARAVEVFRVPPTVKDTLDRRWLAFLQRFKSGATQAGFPSKIANGFTGAAEELISNIIEHSGNAGSGIAGYRCENGVFEYVIADAGIGILATLQENPEYIQLSDHGDAMRLALTDGVTRYVNRSDRGRGYRNLFGSLLSCGASLRFRSGDRRLVIDASSPTLELGRISTSGKLPGFFVSAICRAN